MLGARRRRVGRDDGLIDSCDERFAQSIALQAGVGAYATAFLYTYHIVFEELESTHFNIAAGGARWSCHSILPYEGDTPPSRAGAIEACRFS